MAKGRIIGLITALGFTARAVNAQLEPDCNPLQADCPANKAWPQDSYFIDFTKETGPPANWIIASDEVVNFGPNGAEFTYAKKGDAPSMWTDFYMLGGRYDVEMQVAPGQGIISSAVLWSDVQDEIDWEFSGNQFGEKPFPPPDRMATVETNLFAHGKMWDGAATYQKDVRNPTTEVHKYSVEWDETHMDWYVDDKVVRSVQAKDTPGGFVFPQSPMKLHLGLWAGGDPGNNYWTIQWAGGETDASKTPYTMVVKSVKITNKYPACQYKYNDRTTERNDRQHRQDPGWLRCTSSRTFQARPSRWSIPNCW
ncbi:concanavalin A-like lectin/glucanase domain-containing protein [Biscogniauxia mediterranea]|nr:concanavalin A-like lectin/glucanase domain-containing protein [Biscogniauxia mediterranea]